MPWTDFDFVQEAATKAAATLSGSTCGPVAEGLAIRVRALSGPHARGAGWAVGEASDLAAGFRALDDGELAWTCRSEVASILSLGVMRERRNQDPSDLHEIYAIG